MIIGGGQAGLAVSRSLSEREIEHVVLERGRVGERWRAQSWDSLRLLTPRRLSRLGGWDDGRGGAEDFMHHTELVGYLERYVAEFRVPLRTGVTVLAVERDRGGYRITTREGTLEARAVVVATGAAQEPRVPAMARDLAGWIHQVVPTRYRRPSDLPEGGVLVVGASATGIQLAAEIHASGRPVTLSVGRHTRMPRRYRGADILTWLDRMGLLHQRAEDVHDLEASRSQPSLQLVGRLDRASLDLRILHAAGVRLVGRAGGAAGARMYFGGDLIETLAAADIKLASLRLRIDRFIRESGLPAGPEEPFLPVPLPDAPDALNLHAAGIRTVMWATGFRRRYPWLRVPVLGPSGELVHRGGITASAGLVVLGLPFQRSRSSSFITGVGGDAEAMAGHLERHLNRSHQRAVA
ncbi:MAG: NAD(P)/FAD-dependent oxidoreductase [Gemmatimonadota bacterium]